MIAIISVPRGSVPGRMSLPREWPPLLFWMTLGSSSEQAPAYSLTGRMTREEFLTLSEVLLASRDFSMLDIH